jgi:hypothetical protein
MKHLKKIFYTTIVITSFICLTGFYNEVISNLNTHLIKDSSRFSILNAFSACEIDGRVEPDCAVRQLTRLAQKSEGAKQIIQTYNIALSEGLQGSKECQLPEFIQLNETSGYCVLLMHQKAIQTQNKAQGIMQYQQCIKGAMITLAYAGNVGAQMRLAQIFRQTGDARAQKIWQDLFEAKKEHPELKQEYEMLQKCYGKSD